MKTKEQVFYTKANTLSGKKERVVLKNENLYHYTINPDTGLKLYIKDLNACLSAGGRHVLDAHWVHKSSLRPFPVDIVPSECQIGCCIFPIHTWRKLVRAIKKSQKL